MSISRQVAKYSTKPNEPEMGCGVNTQPRPQIYRHNVQAQVPAWLYRAFLTAGRKASDGRIPIVVVQDDYPFACINLDDLNELLEAAALPRKEVLT